MTEYEQGVVMMALKAINSLYAIGKDERADAFHTAKRIAAQALEIVEKNETGAEV